MSTQVTAKGYAVINGTITDVNLDEAVFAYPTGSFALLPTAGDTTTVFLPTLVPAVDPGAWPAALSLLVDGTLEAWPVNGLKLPAGTHQLQGQVVDLNGARWTSAPITVTVAQAVPTFVPAFPGDCQKGHIRWGLSQPIADHSVPEGVHRTYWQGLSSYSALISAARGDLANGTVPWVSIKGDGTWTEQAAASNTAIDYLITGLMKLTGSVLLTFNHEPMKVTGVPDDPAGATGFLAVCRKIRSRISALGAKNICFLPIYMSGSLVLTNFSTWWDGTIFDAFGVDIYYQHGPITGNTHWTPSVNFALAHNKKLCIGEWGVLDDPDGTTNIRSSHDAMITAGVAAAAYFDSSANSVADWTLAGARLAEWVRIAELASSVAASAS